MNTAPALFVSHGSPMFALEPGRLGPQLTHLGASLTHVKSIVVVSPHWQTMGPLRVTAAAHPETIHDFGGFPEPLYALRYPAPGAPALAHEITQVLESSGFTARVDEMRGLDHGAWVPLRYLKPAADVPVLQVSLPHDATPAMAFRMGQALAPLRDAGHMIVGSGSMTHNLMEVIRPRPDDSHYAEKFAAWIADAIERDDLEALLDYRRQAPDAVRAHPTEEHYVPLLVARGAAGDRKGVRIEGDMTYGVLSMDSYVWGLA